MTQGSFYSQEAAAAAAGFGRPGSETHCWISCGSGRSFCSDHGKSPKAFREKNDDNM